MEETVSAFGLEFFSSLVFGFSGALHLQSTVELVVDHSIEQISDDSYMAIYIVKMVTKNPM